jgi:hypothetical protein
VAANVLSWFGPESGSSGVGFNDERGAPFGSGWEIRLWNTVHLIERLVRPARRAV